MCLEEVNRTDFIIKNIEREIKRMLKDIPHADYRLVEKVEVTPLPLQR